MECSSSLWARLMEGGREQMQGSCFLVYFPVILPNRTSPCPSDDINSRLISTPKGQEEQGLHPQEINQCRGKGCYLFLNGLSKCCEALLFKVSYIIQDSFPYISFWGRKAAEFLHSFYQVNPLILHLFLEMQLNLNKILQVLICDWGYFF